GLNGAQSPARRVPRQRCGEERPLCRGRSAAERAHKQRRRRDGQCKKPVQEASERAGSAASALRDIEEEEMGTRALATSVLSLAILAAAMAADAQERSFELKLSHWVPPSHPLQKALEDWGSAIEKASGGSIKYKVFPAQQLGKAFD